MSLPLSPLGAARFPAGAPAFPGWEPALCAALADSDLPADALVLAWEVSRLPEGATEGERDALALLALALLLSVRDGSTRLSLRADREGPAALPLLLDRLRVGEEGREAALALAERLVAGEVSALAPATGTPDAFAPLVVDGDRLYAQRWHACETRLAASVQRRASAGAPPPFDAASVEAAVGDVLARPASPGGRELRLAGEQREAVAASLLSRLALVTGGPGSGKTSIVLAIVRALARLGVPAEAIALAAPTGKAANRVEESIAAGLASIARPSEEDARLALAPPSARTLHRLLGASREGARFRHGESNLLAPRFVVVDEASMVDLFLMDRLLRALDPGASLVLLGDAGQLPAVDAGAAFRDLCAAAGREGSTVRLARLVESHRMDARDREGRSVLLAARAVEAGDAGALLEGSPGLGPLFGGEAPLLSVVPAGSFPSFSGAELLPAADADGVASFLDRWFDERHARLPDLARLVRKEYRPARDGFPPHDEADLSALLSHLASFRLLAVTRGPARPTGAAAVNARLHARALALAGVSGEEVPAFCPGEPVLVLANDPARGLFNGDQGVVLRVAPAGGAQRFHAVFPRGDGFAAFPLEGLREDLDLAWATTVHKSQGSEFAHVALLLPGEPIPLLTRELVYTALTRARRSAVVVGRPDVLRSALATPVRRDTGLEERLAPVTSQGRPSGNGPENDAFVPLR